MQELQQLSAIAFAPPAAVEPPPPAAAGEQPPAVKCPRCESSNTKFCYYNNYNLSQPRHFCKNCRRYWTKGGALRNIPVGGGTHRKRPNPNPPPAAAISPTSSKRPPATSHHHHPPPLPTPVGFHSNPADDDVAAALDHDKMTSLDFTGSFSSLLAHSNGHHHFENNNILDHHSSSSTSSSPLAAAAALGGGDLNPNSNDDNLLTWANGWPDLAIYTPGSSFQ